MTDDEKVMGRTLGDQNEPEERENIVLRVFYMILIGVMLSLAGTALGVMAVFQVVMMLLNRGEPNERLADAGTDLGIWMAKAARYQTAASEVKPWPWTELD
ncbi:DUF4389 domain-containing protein [Histidinibacterium aquaticum]|uniref:DUF4389 domain-containing protein n=1 Tax=Histidinibacterium aquaticum TaxID=2613962 RepID=A0A5J5GTA6_9RHOB|nr:DUF4389 domain-containing protein [Histidinibacterium aquaticum]KAA9010714.1 DUF4389 domain-containing protein [Histidinibacterium aquaticum]